MADAVRAYRATVHYLQHKLSAQQAITRAGRCLKDAHEGITGCDPSVSLLEAVRADIEVALREARAMANMDDAAVSQRALPGGDIPVTCPRRVPARPEPPANDCRPAGSPPSTPAWRAPGAGRKRNRNRVLPLRDRRLAGTVRGNEGISR